MNTIFKKFIQSCIDIFFNFWFVILILFSLFFISIIYQFSINGLVLNTLFIKHILKIFFSILVIFSITIVDKKFWYAYAYPIYLFIFFLLIIVSLFGTVKLGAQRWIDLYFISIQPSELMKIAIILALSRYYSEFSGGELCDIKSHIQPILILIVPAIFIMKQPDLGTSILVLGIGCSIIFFSKFPIKYIMFLMLSFVITLPLVWFLLKPYQRSRVFTFLDPDRDPLGTGYHILQSKIAIGSGGLYGKGYAKGTQSMLNFLPEKNTDFIFTAIGEEGGFIISFIIIILFMLLIIKLFLFSLETKKIFDKCLCIGTGSMIFLHAFINISMVIGIVPVVGVPIPFISYGGSSLLTFSIGLGIVFSCIKKQKLDILA